VYRYAPIIKHKVFMEEREWWIVTNPVFFIEPGFEYGTGVSTLIPYFRLALGAKSLGIEEVIIGPTPHPDQSFRAVRGLLMKSKIPIDGTLLAGGARVRQSDVSYRNW